ncbi:hypothetical protein [Sphaerimonospora thailandensis]|uniref:Uncharacterized protein n=1 Tax=Sphaerimonospora thailandensis TaxID=795644 RepID=A0A8J3R3Q0_9ACTN|nr:hypothetical protein [Sphaerimonospora thailandensis]GIH67763.1 hypothetical protein Mth01_00160 [Sphaerimonospora thailandensis]
MHRKSRRLVLVALCASTLTTGGVALMSGPAMAATAGATLAPSAAYGIATAATWDDGCAGLSESSYTTSEVALPLAAPELSTVSMPVIAQPVIAQPVLAQPVVAQPVIAQPVLAEPMRVSVSIHPEFAAPRYFRSERFVSEPISYQYRGARFVSELEPAGFRSELSAMTSRAERRIEAATSRGEARIEQRADVAEARIKRTERKAERRLIRKERKLERRLARAAWRHLDP